MKNLLVVVVEKKSSAKRADVYKNVQGFDYDDTYTYFDIYKDDVLVRKVYITTDSITELNVFTKEEYKEWRNDD